MGDGRRRQRRVVGVFVFAAAKFSHVAALLDPSDGRSTPRTWRLFGIGEPAVSGGRGQDGAQFNNFLISVAPPALAGP